MKTYLHNIPVVVSNLLRNQPLFLSLFRSTLSLVQERRYLLSI